MSLLDPRALPPGRTVLVLNSTGSRAGTAAHALAAAGRSAVVVHGGLVAWSQAGLLVDGHQQTESTDATDSPDGDTASQA